MDAANCTPELKKHELKSARNLPNPWLLETKEEGGLYIDALKEKPECLGLIALWLLPSGKSGHTDYVTYYYDKSNDQRLIKITVEYLK